MLKLDAKAAAERIHLAVNAARAPTADDRHVESFATAVCGHLGLEPTALNLTTVVAELSKAGIVPHERQDYPMWVVPHPSHLTRDATGNIVAWPKWAKEHHVDRDGSATVLVENQQEEVFARDPKPPAEADDDPKPPAEAAADKHAA